MKIHDLCNDNGNSSIYIRRLKFVTLPCKCTLVTTSSNPSTTIKPQRNCPPIARSVVKRWASCSSQPTNNVCLAHWLWLGLTDGVATSFDETMCGFMVRPPPAFFYFFVPSVAANNRQMTSSLSLARPLLQEEERDELHDNNNNDDGPFNPLQAAFRWLVQVQWIVGKQLLGIHLFCASSAWTEHGTLQSFKL